MQKRAIMNFLRILYLRLYNILWSSLNRIIHPKVESNDLLDKLLFEEMHRIANNIPVKDPDLSLLIYRAIRKRKVRANIAFTLSIITFLILIGYFIFTISETHPVHPVSHHHHYEHTKNYIV
jgi:uncharacterized membrane protein